jgi:hypothetical protein
MDLEEHQGHQGDEVGDGVGGSVVGDVGGGVSGQYFDAGQHRSPSQQQAASSDHSTRIMVDPAASSSINPESAGTKRILGQATANA